MRQEHRPLRVSGAGREQRVEPTAQPAVRLAEAGVEVLGDVIGGQRRELDRQGLAVERAAPVGEQAAHHPELRPGEDVARGVAVVLDLAADRRIGALLRREDVLKLVEDDQRPRSIALMDPAWKREALEQGRLRLRVELEVDASAHLVIQPQPQPQSGPQAPAQPAKPTREAALEPFQVRPLDSCGHVAEGEHPEEVDVHRGPSLPARIGDHPPQERRLAGAPRRDYAAVVAADGRLQEPPYLRVAIDELLRRERLAIAKRIRALDNRAKLLYRVERGVPA